MGNVCDLAISNDKGVLGRRKIAGHPALALIASFVHVPEDLAWVNGGVEVVDELFLPMETAAGVYASGTSLGDGVLKPLPVVDLDVLAVWGSLRVLLGPRVVEDTPDLFQQRLSCIPLVTTCQQNKHSEGQNDNLFQKLTIQCSA